MSRNSFSRVLQVCLVLFMLFIPAQSAVAHTKLVSSTPNPDSTLSALPRSIELTFNEELLILSDKETGWISVTNAAGERIDTRQPKVSSRTLAVDLLESDSSGSFSVDWRAVAQDGHPVEGLFSFEVTPNVIESSSPEGEVLVEPTTTSSTTYESATDSPIDSEPSLFGVALLALFSASTALVLLRRRNKSK